MANEAKPSEVGVIPSSKDIQVSLDDIAEVASGAAGVASPLAGVAKSLNSTSKGMESTQNRFFESFDKGTDFYTKAMENAENSEERDRIRKDFKDHIERGAQIAKDNNVSWIKIGLFGLAAVALFVAGPSAAAQVLKRL
ncbi:hypothetical protein [Novosphingobium sp. UBA1939]|uniref:hypothetical protein n=1 Tax=Novosphingobium sp. UBA1939 TaxID=1946982 RepID=UPI0025DED3D8|nr:hypothetical protein [Novosphingobium sp. UBA1939]